METHPRPIALAYIAIIAEAHQGIIPGGNADFGGVKEVLAAHLVYEVLDAAGHNWFIAGIASV
jgi:hypothetical protein